MLTCISKMNCLNSNEAYNYADMQRLCKTFILDDIVNFSINSVGSGFPEVNARQILDMIGNAPKNSLIVIFNNLSLILYDLLTEAGFTNITLCYRDFKNNSNDKIVYNIIKNYIKCNFREADKIISKMVTYEELLNMNKHFDYIIANPPFAIGNKITQEVMNKVNFESYINLMPASKYKSGDLFKKVASVESAEDAFTDAVVGESLTIAVLKKADGPYETYEDFSNEFRDPRFVEFYKLNVKCPLRYFNSMRPAIKRSQTITVDKTFIAGKRVCQNGVHKTPDCYDYKFNVLQNIKAVDLPIDGDYYDIWIMQCCSAHEKANFNTFWYKNPLMDMLIKGLNKTGGTPAPAIPNIDFSKDRDYEHLTLDDIMNILREENPNV